MQSKTIQYQPDPNKFDLQVHKWDGQGRLVGKNPYRSFIIEGRQVFERPVGSGNLWLENNEPGGRVEYKVNAKGHIFDKRFDFDAPHKEWERPLEGDEKLHFELQQERARVAELEAKLAALNGQKDEKAPDNSRILAAVQEGIPTADMENEKPRRKGKK